MAKKPKRSLTPQAWAALDKAGMTPRSGASRSAAGKTRATPARPGIKTPSRLARAGTRTSNQIAAAKRNLEKARQAARRKLGGTTALRLKTNIKRAVSKVTGRINILRGKIRKALK